MRRLAGVALALSAVALGVAVVALTRRPPEPPRAPARTDGALQAQIDELRRDLDALEARRPDAAVAPRPPEQAPGSSSPGAVEGAGGLEAIVDDAVERKTERVIDEMRIKADKKPAIDVFATTLELTKEQRDATERVVVEGQRELHAILATPAYDGSNLMDQLVEIAAKGIAEPGKDHGFGLWLARVLGEKIPGTDETYGARIESVKQRMRAAFKREWSDAQYKEFEAWGVDPTEVENVPGSPNEALMKRITERARALGAVLQED